MGRSRIIGRQHPTSSIGQNPNGTGSPWAAQSRQAKPPIIRNEWSGRLGHARRSIRNSVRTGPQCPKAWSNSRKHGQPIGQTPNCSNQAPNRLSRNPTGRAGTVPPFVSPIRQSFALSGGDSPWIAGPSESPVGRPAFLSPSMRHGRSPPSEARQSKRPTQPAFPQHLRPPIPSSVGFELSVQPIPT